MTLNFGIFLGKTMVFEKDLMIILKLRENPA